MKTTVVLAPSEVASSTLDITAFVISSPNSSPKANVVVVVGNEAVWQREFASHRIRRFPPNQPPTENAETRSTD